VDPAVESWREILLPQALDLALLTAFMALALVSFFRKSVTLKYVTFVAAVGYLGFAKSSLVSISDVFRLTDLSMPPFKYSLAWYVFMLFVVVSTVLWGRVYCGRVCAFGALTQLMDPIVPRKMRLEIPVRIEKHANLIKYGVLASVLVYFIVTRDVALPIRYVEPFWMFGLFGTTAMWIGLAVLLVATVFVRNLYCRFLCPVGAALGIISNLTVFRIKRWSECNTCKICEKTCEWGAIRGPKIVASECVRCDDCERLYMDQKKCPHWLILFKRKGNTAVPVSTPG
jgi:NosR/NirI family transcriptional regulator, nitrous oxide reductase regulator